METQLLCKVKPLLSPVLDQLMTFLTNLEWNYRLTSSQYEIFSLIQILQCFPTWVASKQDQQPYTICVTPVKATIAYTRQMFKQVNNSLFIKNRTRVKG
jgi:hypothetical protein